MRSLAPSTQKIADRHIYSTKNYDQFNTLMGNREIDQRHVTQLIRLMVTNGNLTDQFPIVVDKDMNVIDGQHRLEALKTLGWEVGYLVENAASIETVRNINQGNRNWTWRDMAESYARLPGGEEYAWFLTYFDRFDMTYTLAMLFIGAKQPKRAGAANRFNAGELKVEDKEKAVRFAAWYTDLQELVDITTHDFGKALNRIFRSPFYDHERMVSKLSALGHQLPAKANISDYQRELERIFNSGLPEEKKVRLF